MVGCHCVWSLSPHSHTHSQRCGAALRPGSRPGLVQRETVDSTLLRAVSVYLAHSLS